MSDNAHSPIENQNRNIKNTNLRFEIWSRKLLFAGFDCWKETRVKKKNHQPTKLCFSAINFAMLDKKKNPKRENKKMLTPVDSIGWKRKKNWMGSIAYVVVFYCVLAFITIYKLRCGKEFRFKPDKFSVNQYLLSMKSVKPNNLLHRSLIALLLRHFLSLSLRSKRCTMRPLNVMWKRGAYTVSASKPNIQSRHVSGYKIK